MSFEYKRPVVGICAGEETLNMGGTEAGLGSGGTLTCGCNGDCCTGAGAGVLGSSTLHDVLEFEWRGRGAGADAGIDDRFSASVVSLDGRTTLR